MPCESLTQITIPFCT